MRLKDMGIEPFLLGSSLSGVLSQRLVRRLCQHCKVAAPDNAVSQRLLAAGETHYTGHGCEHCNQLGYRGRIGLYELLVIDETLRDMIFQGQSESALQRHIDQRQTGLGEYGLQLVKQGITSLEEVMRVTRA